MEFLYFYFPSSFVEHKVELFTVDKTEHVFGNRVLREMFVPKRDEVTGEWRKLHNEKLHDLCCSPTIVRVIKARRMR
jgi:hypothetical protein